VNPVINTNFIDYLILGAYVSVTIMVGYSLRKYMKTSEDFFDLLPFRCAHNSFSLKSLK
jgi:hypothetical protein